MTSFRFNIRSKFIFILSLLVVIIISISTFFSYFRANNTLQTEIQKYGIAVTKTFTKIAATHIFETDYITVLESALSLIKSSDIRSITVINKDGKIWVSTKKGQVNPVRIEPFYEDTIKSKQLSYRKIRKDAESILEFTGPITALGRVTHLVNLEISLNSMEKQLKERTQNILVLSCIMISIAVFVSIVLSKWLTNPIKNLVNGTNEISQGNLDYRIKVNSQDEIGVLSQSFNHMADNLLAELSERKQAEKELIKHRNHLEDLVNKRTAELVKSNREMEKEIEERKQVEKALRESEIKLQRSQRMESLGLLAGGVAHDLNNVLSGIVSYPEILLLNLPEGSKLKKPIKRIQESGLRATDIVNDLLTLARGAPITKEPININDPIREYLASPEFNKLEKFHPAVTVKTDLDAGLFNIHGSHVHIRKAVMNLVSNASEAIEGNGTVTLATRNRYLDKPMMGYDHVNKGEYVVLSVSDTGSGISADDLDRIFEPFYTKKIMGRSGTGLGLSVVWNVLQDHEGYKDIKTSENGTTFELFFPMTRDNVSDKELSLSDKDIKGDGETILVVDDLESQREVSCKMLEVLGYKAIAVASGEDAIEYFQKNTADLVLLDMIMDPGINGRETYEGIVKIHPEQKAIILSGFAETEEVKETQKLGAGRYIKKPVTLKTIGFAVKEELRK